MAGIRNSRILQAHYACSSWGKAELFDGSTKEFDEGLAVYYFEYGAEAQKIPVEQMKQMMKKGMIMTRITVDQITITDSTLKNAGFRTRQRWSRK